MCTQPYHYSSVNCIGWEKPSAIDFRLDISTVCYFSIKKITQFCRTSSLSSHRGVINRGNSSCGFCLCILSVTSRVSMYKRTILRSFSFLHSSYCQTFISYIYIYIYIYIYVYWLNVVGTVNEKMKTRACMYVYSPSTNIVPWSISFWVTT
jgi:hypothetical protein